MPRKQTEPKIIEVTVFDVDKPTLTGNIYTSEMLTALIPEITNPEHPLTIEEVSPQERNLKKIPPYESWTEHAMALCVGARIEDGKFICGFAVKNNRFGKLLLSVLDSSPMLLVENGDGHIVQKNLLGMGEAAIQCEPIQKLLTDSFVVIIADKQTRSAPPVSMIQYTKNFVYVENTLAGARLLASMEKNIYFNEDLVILGNDDMLQELNDQSLPYRISLLTIDGVEPRQFDGFKVTDSVEDGIYKLVNYDSDIQNLSEDRLNSIIENMDIWMNDQDTFGDKVDEVVDAMQKVKDKQDNHFLDSMVEYDADGNPMPLEDKVIVEEFSRLWDEMIDLASQVGKVIDISQNGLDISKQALSETSKAMSLVSKKLDYFDDKIIAHEHSILENQDKLYKTRNQLGLVVSKTENMEKSKKHIGPWIISGVALVISVINCIL